MDGNMCIHECRSCGILKRVPDPLETELKAVVSHLAWVLGTQFRFFTRVLHGAQHLASLQPLDLSFSAYSMLLQRTVL